MLKLIQMKAVDKSKDGGKFKDIIHQVPGVYKPSGREYSPWRGTWITTGLNFSSQYKFVIYQLCLPMTLTLNISPHKLQNKFQHVEALRLI